MSNDYRTYGKPLIAQPNQQLQVEAGKKPEVEQKPSDRGSDLVAKTVPISKEIFAKQNGAADPSKSLKEGHQFGEGLSNENLPEKVENAAAVLHPPVADQPPSPLVVLGQVPNNISQSLSQEIDSPPQSEEISQAKNEPEQQFQITPEQFAALTREELKALKLTPEQLDSILDSLTDEQLDEYDKKNNDINLMEKENINVVKEAITQNEAIALQNKEIALQKDETALLKEESALQNDEVAAEAEVIMSEGTIEADKQERLEATEVEAVANEISNLPSDLKNAYASIGNKFIHLSRLTREEHQEIVRHPEKTIIFTPDGILKHAPGQGDKFKLDMPFSFTLEDGRTISVPIIKIIEMTKEEHEAFQASLTEYLSALFPTRTATKDEDEKEMEGKHRTVEHQRIKQQPAKRDNKDDLNLVLQREAKLDKDAAIRYEEMEKHIEDQRTEAAINHKIRQRKLDSEDDMRSDHIKSVDKGKNQNKADLNAKNPPKPAQKLDNSETIKPTPKSNPPPPRSPLDV